MDALIRVAGAPVLSGRLTMPLRGPWTFDGKVDVDALPSGSVEIACKGGLSLTGTVDATRSGVVLDSSHVWIVGGAGGLGKPVSGAWRSAQLRDPLAAILSAGGETLSDTVDSSLLGTALSSWRIPTTTVSGALNSLATFASGATGLTINWRTLLDGTIWIGAETWEAFTMDATDSVAMIYPVESRTVVSVSVPTVYPGLNVTGPSDEAIGNVAAVEHWIGPRGVQSWLFTDGDTGSSAALFTRNVRAALRLPPDPESFPRLDHLALYPARVDAQAGDGSTVDVTPLNPLLTPQQAVPLRIPFPGCTMLFAAGAIVRVGWDEGDPSKMFALPAFDGGTLTKLTVTGGELDLLGGTSPVKVTGSTIDLKPASAAATVPVLLQGSIDSWGVPVTQLATATNAVTAG